MSYISFPNSFTSGQSVDAAQFNQNFQSIVDGSINYNNDIIVSSANISGGMTIASNIVADDVTATSGIVGITMTVGGNITVDGITFFESIFRLSGDSQTTVSTGDLSDGSLSFSQCYNRLLFEDYTGDIKYISTANFVDGDVLIVANITSDATGIVIKNSDASGNIYCGSDISLLTGDIVGLIYNGTLDSFDRIMWTRSCLDFFTS